MARTDGRQGDQTRSSLCHQPIQLLIEFGDLFGELLVAAGHRTQREPGRRLHVSGIGPKAKTRAATATSSPLESPRKRFRSVSGAVTTRDRSWLVA